MDSLSALEISREAIYILLKVSLPILIGALSIGLIVSLFQALTQIQEPTLSFVPKIITVLLILLFTLNFIGANLMSFTEEIISMIIHQS